ncbi:MAG: glycosyltransferase family 4 protein [Caulobacteraceae bacterium]|nr:glycosyltransferase family 4 protein [Caulobacteraceae bacterium]
MNPLGVARDVWKRLAPLEVRERAAPLIEPAARAYQRMAARRHWSDVPGDGPIRVVGFMDGSHGIAAGAKLTARALQAVGAEVETIGVSFTDVSWREPIHDRPAAPAWIFQLNPPELVGALSALAVHPQGPRFGYWAWELPQAPRRWLKDAIVVSEIWAPSRHTAQAFAGADRPVRVAPHPLFMEDYEGVTPRPRTAGFMAVALCDLNSSEARKNPSGAIEAFRLAFGGDPGAKLVVKTQNGATHPQQLAQLKAAAGLNVEVIDATWPYAEVLGLIAAADVLISLHRAEGFGLPLAEAMALGTPVIATGWSANLDFMDETTGVLIHSQLVPVRDPQGVYVGQTWADPDLDAAAEALRRLRSRPQWRAELAAAARVRVARQLSPQAWFDGLPEAVKRTVSVAS